MKTELRTDITIGDICKGFYYNTLEGKGVRGWNGKLVIWVSRGHVREYLKDHRYNPDISELKQYFESVIANVRIGVGAVVRNIPFHGV